MFAYDCVLTYLLFIHAYYRNLENIGIYREKEQTLLIIPRLRNNNYQHSFLSFPIVFSMYVVDVFRIEKNKVKYNDVQY